MSGIQPLNTDEIKRQTVVRFLSEMQAFRQKIETEFASRFDEQKNNFLSTAKSSYSPTEIGTIFDTLKSLEIEFMRSILTRASGDGSKILGNTISSVLSGNLTFSGEATERIAELERENNRLKAELHEKEKAFEKEKIDLSEKGEVKISELNRLQEMIDEQKRTIEMYETQTMSHGESLAQQRMEIEELQTQIGEASNANNKLKEALKAKEETIEGLQIEITAQKEQIETMDNRIQQMRTVSADKFEAQTGRLESTLGLERERADDLEVRLKESSTALENYKEAIEQKDEEIDMLRKTVTSMKSDKATASSEKDAQIKKLSDDLKALEHQLADRQDSLERAEKRVETITKELEAKTKMIDARDDEIRETRSMLTDAKDTISTEKSSLESRLNELLKAKTKYEAEINDLKKEIRDLNNNLDDKEKTIAELSKAQDVIDKDRDAVQEERDKILVQLENMKARISELEGITEQKESLVKNLTKSLQSIPKFQVFLAIQEIGGEITLSGLSKIVGHPPKIVDHIVNDLKKDGLVKVSQKENKLFVARI